MVKQGMADALICGTHGQYEKDLTDLTQIIGKADGVADVSALSLVVVPSGSYFLCDTHVSPDPTAEEIAGMVRLAAEEVKRFGLEPKVALLSHSNFGTRNSPSAIKMREAVALLHASDPDLEVEGEMHADAAINESIRARVFPNSKLKGSANLLVAPSLDSANIAFKPAENHRRWPVRGADADGHGEAGAYRDPVGYDARRREYDGLCGGRRAGSLKASVCSRLFSGRH